MRAKNPERSIGSILKQLREEHNYSCVELAEYFKADASLILEWESGQKEPTISQCLILSKLYGIPLDDMFGGLDVKAMLPEKCIGRFNHERQLNAAAARWYD